MGVALLAMFTPTDDGPTFCPFALLTGTACPGCGMTRAASYLFKGDVTMALSYHPLIPLIVAEVFAGWTWFALRRRGLVGPLPQWALNTFLIATTAALLLVWGARLISGTLPPV